MRININLATQKYQDAGEFYVRWMTPLVLVLVVTLGLAFYAWYNYRSTVQDSKRIRDLREKIARVDEQRRQAEAVLNRPENQDVRDQSQFWNDVIDQKSFSWTHLFSDLEKIMPERAYVTSAEPKVTLEKRVQLRLVFVGEKFDNANELLSKMERLPERFQSPELVGTEVRAQSTAPGAPTVVQFEILTYYTPGVVGQESHGAAAKEGA